MSWVGKTLFTLVIVFGIVLVGFVSVFSTKVQMPNYCQMTYMNPFYADITVSSTYSYKYNLLLYREGKQSYKAFQNDARPKGIPVLFIPGNAGHYKQVRSIASQTAYLCDSVRQQYGVQALEFDFFTINSQEELSGLNGEIMREQTQYINDCIKAILRSYRYLPTYATETTAARPTSVLLIGHSMGGLIASAVFTQPNYVPDSVNTILTLNTPHNDHPFLYRRSIATFYDEIRNYWTREINSTLKEVALISIGGSFRDQLIDSSLTSLHQMIPTSHSFSTVTTSIPNVWVQTDHQCILWCNQIIQKIAQLLLELVHRQTFQNSRSLHERLYIFQEQLLSNLPVSLGLLQPSDDQFVPAAYVNEATRAYFTAPNISAIHPLSSGERFISTVPYPLFTDHSLLFRGRTYPPSSGISPVPISPVYRIPLPSHIYENSQHVVILSDVAVGGYEILICQERRCSQSLDYTGVQLPAHSSFKEFSDRDIPVSQPDASPISFFHFSPYQLQSATHLFLIFPSTQPLLLFTQVYSSSDSDRYIETANVTMSLTLEKGHAAVQNISLPFFRKHEGAYVAHITQVPDASVTCAFHPIAIQYRSALQEQHIYTNASVVPLRFHVSSIDHLRFIILSDPHCVYRVDMQLDIPLTLVGYFYSHANAFVSGILFWGIMTLSLQLWSFYARASGAWSFYSAAQRISAIGIPILLASLFIPDSFFSLFFQQLPSPLNQHSFYNNEIPTPEALRITLFCAFCGCVVYYTIVNGIVLLIQYVCQLIIPLTDFVNNRGKLILFALVALSSFFSHVIVILVFTFGLLVVCDARALKDKRGIRNLRRSILGLLMFGIIESVPSFVQFCKSYNYEMRSDDGFLLMPYSLCVLSVLSGLYTPHRYPFAWMASFVASILILAYSLVPFYRIAWFVGFLAVAVSLSYLPLQSLPTNRREKIE